MRSREPSYINQVTNLFDEIILRMNRVFARKAVVVGATIASYALYVRMEQRLNALEYIVMNNDKRLNESIARRQTSEAAPMF